MSSHRASAAHKCRCVRRLAVRGALGVPRKPPKLCTSMRSSRPRRNHPPYAEQMNIEDFVVDSVYRLTVRIRGEDEETVTGRVVGYSSAWFQSPESVLEMSLLVLDTAGELRALKSYSLDQIQGAEII